MGRGCGSAADRVTPVRRSLQVEERRMMKSEQSAADLLPAVIFGPLFLVVGVLLFRNAKRFQESGLTLLARRDVEIGEAHVALVRAAGVLFATVGIVMLFFGLVFSSMLLVQSI